MVKEFSDERLSWCLGDAAEWSAAGIFVWVSESEV